MTVASSVSLGLGRLVAGETDAIWVPRGGCQGRRAVLLLHGQLQTTTDWMDNSNKPGQYGLANLLAGLGLVVIAAHLGGPAWGNATALADIDAALPLAASLGAAADKILLLGASMGAFEAFSYMAAYPAKVAAAVGVIPALDLGDIRDNNRASATDYVNAAWGLTLGSTSSTVALPAGAELNTTAKAAAIATSGPVLLAYSTADAVALPAKVTQFAGRVGSSCTTVVCDTTLGHADGSIGAAAGLTSAGRNQIAGFLYDYSAAPPSHYLTEAVDRLATEAGDALTLEAAR